ncbi:WYL domain-containing protein [Nocardioides sp. TF02-7]|uniref:WYL domain-containing protein n=1 Tax=Nocardioides sp. TF02-7 TaxID=2917724 RepID=UPI001F069FE3|nr:WYL domain-containing protein [Nocardioides sp. TF02-7]UMG91667.1 WYL domain-containing protein [Nocardioides sp. TF02-7]
MTWEIDPPVDVTLRTTTDFEPDVRRWLGPPAAVEPAGEDVVLRYRVTHRAALRARLYELGRRVVLVGPEDVRRELVAELEERRGGAS